MKPESFAAEVGLSLDDLAFLIALGDTAGVGIPQKMLGGKLPRIEKRYAVAGPEFCNGALVSLADAAASIDLSEEEAATLFAEAAPPLRFFAVRGERHVSCKQLEDWKAAPPAGAAAAPAAALLLPLTAAQLAERARFEGGAADIDFLVHKGLIKPADVLDAGAAAGVAFPADSADALIARIIAELQPLAPLCAQYEMTEEELLGLELDSAAAEPLRPVFVLPAVCPSSTIPDAAASNAAAGTQQQRRAFLIAPRMEALKAVLPGP